MTGFTIYETLRIFTPGALAVLVLDVSLRLSTARSVMGVAGAGAIAVADAIEGIVVFVLLAWVLGLLLYLIDLPERLRIFGGDPRWAVLPSEEMRRIIGKTSPPWSERYGADALSLFFILSDRFLPDDLHRRIYLFGAIYRIFVDWRVLLVTALTVSTPAAIVAARYSVVDDSLGFSGTAAIGISITVCYVVVMGAFAVRTHSVRHFESNPTEDRTAPPELGAASVALVAVLASTSIMTAMWAPTPAAWWSLLPAAAAVTWWFCLEIGSPKPDARRWRDEALAAMGCQPSDRPQFSGLQRTLIDLAVYVPVLVGASAATAYLGRPPVAVLGWAVLVVPATTIMTVRKHESRLLGAYKHQAAWLKLHELKIREVLEGKAGFGDLEEAPQPTSLPLVPPLTGDENADELETAPRSDPASSDPAVDG